MPLTTLDAIAESGTAPGLIKIDTESTEPDVLAGGLSFIKAARPWIICEVLYNVTEHRLRLLVDSIGYYPYALRGRPLLDQDLIEGDKEYKLRDWLLAPEPPDPAFNAAYVEWVRAFQSVGMAPG